MASNTETGHAVNLSNFKFIIDTCNAFGAVYNPSNAALTIANMTTQWTTVDGAHQTLTAAVQASKNPINQRQILFEPVDKLVTRTISYFDSTGASTQIKTDARGLANRYRGFGIAVDKLPDGTPDPADVSNSHQGYVQKAESFKQMIDLYNSDGNYSPNEVELQTGSLTGLYNDMKAANDNIGNILAPVTMARITRDHGMYDATSGIIDVALACKNYVKGIFGAASPEYKTISGLRFSRPKK